MEGGDIGPGCQIGCVFLVGNDQVCPCVAKGEVVFTCSMCSVGRCCRSRQTSRSNDLTKVKPAVWQGLRANYLQYRSVNLFLVFLVAISACGTLKQQRNSQRLYPMIGSNLWPCRLMVLCSHRRIAMGLLRTTLWGADTSH